MNISGLKDSKFLKKEDCGNGILVTIRHVHQENVAKEGAPQELKWCIEFDEVEKPLVLNSTNGQIIAAVCGSQETDDWTGHKIVLFSDPNIQFQGKLVGGIRARAPRNQAPAKAPAVHVAARQSRPPAAQPQPAPAPAQQDPVQESTIEDDVPF